MIPKLTKVTLKVAFLLNLIFLCPAQFQFTSDNFDPLDTIKFQLNPPEVSSMGHEIVKIEGLTLTPGQTAVCQYNDVNNNPQLTNVTANILTPKLAMCPVPYLYSWDVKVNLIVDGDNNTYESDLRVKQFTWDIVANVTSKDNNGSIILQWSPDLFSSDTVLDLTILSADPFWKEVIAFEDIQNSGEFEVPPIDDIIILSMDIVTFQLRSKFAEKFAFSNILLGLKVFSDDAAAMAQAFCDEWYQSDIGPPPVAGIETCPCSVSQANLDKRFVKEEYNYPNLDYYHPDADVSFRQTTPNANGAGQQCVYKGGQIRVGQPSGGSVDWSSPLNTPDMLGHLRHDLLPWTLCCKESESLGHCRKYYDKRPSNGCDGYIPPTPGGGSGDPHMTTFDRVKYDFMGYGEFWVVKMGSSFGLQGRMSPLPGAVTQFTAFAMYDGSTRVQVDTFSGPVVRINGEIISLQVVRTGIVTPTANIKMEGSKVTASFNSGFTVAMQGNSLLVTASGANAGKTAGLLGNFDSIQDNDLTAPDGTVIPLDSSRAEIHYNFGLPWMITKDESFFVYPAGMQYENYSHPEFGPTLEFPDVGNIPEEIKRMCGESLDCLFDYAFTNDTDAANATRWQEDELSDLVDNADENVPTCRSITDANIPNGFVTITNYFVGSEAKFGCNEGFSLVGEEAIYCLQFGGEPRWSDNIPTCE